MIFFWNRKRLRRCSSVVERNRICTMLRKAGIPFFAKVCGTNQRDPRRIFWFWIYVSKEDYPRALALIRYQTEK